MKRQRLTYGPWVIVPLSALCWGMLTIALGYAFHGMGAS